MAVDLLDPGVAAGTPVATSPRAGLPGSVWRGPLVPVALALTAGIVLDRRAAVPPLVSFLAAAVFLSAFALTRLARQRGLALIYLWAACAALGAFYHHWRLNVTAPDDIGRFAATEPRPVRLRGVLEREPVHEPAPPADPLRTFPAKGATRLVLRVSRMKDARDWRPASGLALVRMEGGVRGLGVGDEVEAVGALVAPPGPANPGGFDYAAHLRDQGVRAVVAVRGTDEGIIRHGEGGPRSLRGWLAALRAWGNGVLERALPREQWGLAKALLLGEGEALTDEQWEKYFKTGVIHVLAISGQHLAVLGGFLWLALRLVRVRRRHAACAVALFLLGYALLAGGRPPVMRAAWMTLALCGGLLLRRPVLAANTFALAWIGVAAFNPADVFNAGCQLSFLSVAVLFLGTSAWNRAAEAGPLDQLIEESRPFLVRAFRRLVCLVLWGALLNAAVWVAVAPLVAGRFHVVAPVALIIGPPVTAFGSFALVTGFLLLIFAPFAWPLAQLFGGLTSTGLRCCEAVVDWGVRLPGAYWYVGDVAEGWLWVFYAGLLAGLALGTLRARWRWSAAGLTAWLAAGLLGAVVPSAAGEFRCTFLAVGHGGCTVIETPDGRVLLYDAGAITGPDVTRYHIAPFLWHRGVRRIDELFLSHADLDHFNGVPALLDRFAVGQVTCTPTFGDRATVGVRRTLEELGRRGVPVRVVRAGDRLRAGEVQLDVLHPPAAGPDGNENARSLVLLVRYRRHALLLTGDLEGPGLERVLKLPPPRLEVLMAPHHGSRTANTPDLAAWARPKVVVSCQGAPRSPRRHDPYAPVGAEVFGTWPHGAVTVRDDARGLVLETYVTKQGRLVAPRR